VNVSVSNIRCLSSFTLAKKNMKTVATKLELNQEISDRI